MSEMWCWPQLFVQPEMFTRTPGTSARPASSSASPIGRREAARLRDREVARVGARARHDVACELGAGLGHADVVQPVVERPDVGLVQVAQREVLAVRDADVEVEVALDVGEGAELVGGDVAEPRVRHRADRAVRSTPRTTFASCQRSNGIARQQLDRARTPDRPSSPRACRPRARRRLRGRPPECPTASRARRAGTCAPGRCARAARRCPIESTSHFMRARILLSRLP